MADKNKHKENTFKAKTAPAPEPPKKQVIDTEEKSKEKQKKEPQKKSETPSKAKGNKTQKTNEKKETDGRIWTIIGILFLCLAAFLAFALISYFVSFFSGQHQEYGAQILSKEVAADSRTGSMGVFLGQTLIKESFGLGAFFFVYLLGIIGFRLVDATKIKMWSVWKYALLCLVWMPLFFAYISTFAPKCAIFGGATGLWLYTILNKYIGKLGIVIILAFLFLVFAVYQFNLTLNYFKQLREKREEKRRREAALIAEQRIKEELEKENQYLTDNGEDIDPDSEDEDEEIGNSIKKNENDKSNLPPVTSFTKDPAFEVVTPENNAGQSNVKENVFIEPKENQNESQSSTPVTETVVTPPTNITNNANAQNAVPVKRDTEAEKVELVIENTPKEEIVEKPKSMEHHTIDTPFDPHYELRDFKFPSLDMLNDYGGKKAQIDNEELEANKNKIVETLGNYGIAIDKIKATIGPTVTLYEIVPAAGVRISKIKNLEDDIALSLAALGIRIIAPIPGKGTIGIEVPNSKPETVSMRSVLASEKFQNSKYALPCAIGKTISNETYVFDLAKMPHILMAGATGQGKSVGLNAIIASLLYCKHPSELKFVMVDPKKVELTLYNRIERHYLAKLPDSEDAIITDVKKVVRTLNSLCIEMDQRYDLLKSAECRNIIEYNEKFKARKLLPTEGHRFLPYIVLIVDEFADLIMTAGREVEAPIARLAQLALAIGIHLIIATQRPSVNIITGSIKANFPARIAFRVISQVDSKTILDQSGANQLIGRGDMLLSTGNDLVRLQCAFIDTPEVETVTEFIGAQRGYSEPFLLPEVPEEEGDAADVEDDGERDSLFEEAARIVVQTQQGSTSMIQRKLKLGYNRAGRIIDQLEAAGIVGPFSGSKSREVKVGTEAALEQILRDLYNKDNGI